MPSSLLTVTGGAEPAARRLCTLDAVKAELQIAGTGDDVALLAKIDEASAAIADYCQRVIAQEEVSEEISLQGEVDALVLERRPAAVSTVTEDGIELDPADYRVDPAAGMLWRRRSGVRTPWRAAEVVVAYSAGWDLQAEKPAGLARACVILVTTWWKGRGRDVAVRSHSVEGIDAVSYVDPRNGGGSLPDAVTDLIDDRFRAVHL